MPIVNGKYQNPGWVNGQRPPINAAELNAISDTLERLDEAPVLPTLTNPGTIGDLVFGKQLIDQNGNMLVGIRREPCDLQIFSIRGEDPFVYPDFVGPMINVTISLSGKNWVRYYYTYTGNGEPVILDAGDPVAALGINMNNHVIEVRGKSVGTVNLRFCIRTQQVYWDNSKTFTFHVTVTN